MEEAREIDPDLADLVVQLCTRVGMIMEDVIPLAVNVSPDGLEGRVVEVARSIRAMATLAEAVQVLLHG